ncbi:hypothetical protein [Mesobacillus maritimus]|uniref:Aminoglycoside phosphotransferase domain-containing protein n=1 Tax=Mesobacillus maritimus TaxID=1643336 RepID=A0ABS7K861_9BACI|nr:hypothetical protein [Mesobacillus maritimus]MBY0098429.1 hypothetical protein [Mesobacillus maritimus]
MVYNDETLDFAVKNSGLGPLKRKNQISFLGEGAWHHAYLVSTNHTEKFVVRLPKKVSVYGDKVEYDEKAIHADYRGTQLYYETANTIKAGICPEFFHYYNAPGKTYTIETYKGPNVKLADLTSNEAFSIGFQMGEFFREMNKVKHSLKGYGYLSWNGKEVEGRYQTDVSTFMKEENEEYAQDFERVCSWDKRFASDEIKSKLMDSLASRSIDANTISITNQDASPENILFYNGQVSLIDPFPILYYGHSLAGNFLNCYETIFPTYFNTKRYERHQFNLYTKELREITNGYLHGYTCGDSHIKQLVRREQFIRLANLTYDHFVVATGELSKRAEVGMGTRDVINERISVFLEMLRAFNLDG